MGQAKKLRHGQTLYHIAHINADGTAQRWRVSGKPKTWARNPERIKIPVKHGLYNHGYVTESDLSLMSLIEPKRKKR